MGGQNHWTLSFSKWYLSSNFLYQKSKIEILGGVIEGVGVRNITPQIRYLFEVSNFDWPLTCKIWTVEVPHLQPKPTHNLICFSSYEMFFFLEVDLGWEGIVPLSSQRLLWSNLQKYNFVYHRLSRDLSVSSKRETKLGNSTIFRSIKRLIFHYKRCLAPKMKVFLKIVFVSFIDALMDWYFEKKGCKKILPWKMPQPRWKNKRPEKCLCIRCKYTLIPSILVCL